MSTSALGGAGSPRGPDHPFDLMADAYALTFKAHAAINSAREVLFIHADPTFAQCDASVDQLGRAIQWLEQAQQKALRARDIVASLSDTVVLPAYPAVFPDDMIEPCGAPAQKAVRK